MHHPFMHHQRWGRPTWRWFVILTIGLLGCTGTVPKQRIQEDKQQERNEKIRNEAARLTERTKPEVQWTVKKLAQAAERIADAGLAAVEGVVEGWSRGGHKVLDINSATEGELSDLPGITQRDARKIMQGRPYRSTGELVAKRVLSDAAYLKIRDQITAR
jgi:DNA uptake protein ComE-like DNA-binding protein